MTVPTGASTATFMAQESDPAHQQHPAQHLNSRVTLITSYKPLDTYEKYIPNVKNTDVYGLLWRCASEDLLARNKCKTLDGSL